VRRKQRLNVENVDRPRRRFRLFFNTLIKACSSTIGPRDALINRAVGFILSSSAAPTRPRVRLLNTNGSSGYLPARTAGLWKPGIATRGLGGVRRHVLASRQSDSFQKRSQSARLLIQSVQVPECPGSCHGDPCHCLLPAARPDGVALRHDMSRGGQDQRPGEFDRGVRPIPGVNHCDPRDRLRRRHRSTRLQLPSRQ